MPETSDWIAFEDGLLPELPGHAERPGRVVAVVASEAARAEGWAGTAVAVLAAGWSESHRVVVVDASLSAPLLHDTFSLENAEGLADAVVFGTSIRRIAYPVRGGGFYVVPAGSIVAESSVVLASERWRRLREGFVDAGVTLVLFASGDEIGAALEGATDVVALAPAGQQTEGWLPRATDRLRAVVGSSGQGQALPAAAPGPAASGTTRAAAPTPADVLDLEGPAGTAGPDDALDLDDSGALPEPTAKDDVLDFATDDLLDLDDPEALPEPAAENEVLDFATGDVLDLDDPGALPEPAAEDDVLDFATDDVLDLDDSGALPEPAASLEALDLDAAADVPEPDQPEVGPVDLLDLDQPGAAPEPDAPNADPDGDVAAGATPEASGLESSGSAPAEAEQDLDDLRFDPLELPVVARRADDDAAAGHTLPDGDGGQAHGGVDAAVDAPAVLPAGDDGGPDPFPTGRDPAVLAPEEAAITSGAGAEDEATESPATERRGRKASSPGKERSAPGSRPSRGSRPRVLLVLSVILLAIVGAAAAGLVFIRGITPEEGANAGQHPGDLVPVARSVPLAPDVQHLAYSVGVGAFQDQAAAQSRASSLAAEAGVLAVLVPVEVEGSVFHRVILGTAADSASAAELAATFASVTGFDRSSWVVRATPLAFALEELAELEVAEARAAEMRTAGIPAYVLALDFADGSVRYRVYAGAYENTEESSYLSRRLEDAGLVTSKLTERLGRLPR